MQKRRLLKLADLLEADAKNKKGAKFDLGVVGTSSNGGAEEFTPALDCGTTACAMGLAAISGAFVRAGLSYSVDGKHISTTLNGKFALYSEAASAIFSISDDEAHFLFTPSRYNANLEIVGAKGERLVAKRIRDFVAGKVSA